MDLATIQIKVDTRQVKAANEDIKQLGTTGQMTSKKVNAANDDMAKSAKSTTSAFKLLGGAMAALGVGALVSNFASVVTESERLKGSLKTMTGSTEDAAFAFAELEKFASQTPFTLDQSVEGFIKLKALGLDPSERALRSYGNTSAAMGKDMMQMIEAVADASTGEFERLKEFGIKASKQGDDVSLTFQGVTTTIGNSSAEIQNYLLEIGETKFGTGPVIPCQGDRKSGVVGVELLDELIESGIAETVPPATDRKDRSVSSRVFVSRPRVDRRITELRRIDDTARQAGQDRKCRNAKEALE